MNNIYSFEYYDNAAESRKWQTKFIKEHNGKNKSPTPLTDVITHKLCKWVRIRRNNTIVGYARTSKHDGWNATISDVYILKKYRGQGIYHDIFGGLIIFSEANGVCLGHITAKQYGYFYKQFGFDYEVDNKHNEFFVNEQLMLLIVEDMIAKGIYDSNHTSEPVKKLLQNKKGLAA